jgi:hypothetical protein
MTLVVFQKITKRCKFKDKWKVSTTSRFKKKLMGNKLFEWREGREWRFEKCRENRNREKS